ncbi:hypothetical protein EPUL_001481 [Erysiphe pulchra]|uniref:S-methyl-5'-thioadenosine phosphorylase n=1 Tax=Erysiphe pulchra TaxID=225359 RepID=A0A2S4PTE8_9PEZI|nr:hypothetical protein EPUL_001481 [Erysiphe pulchra]
MFKLPADFNGTINVAVIGGTGIQKLDGFVPVASVNPHTPWGYPSAPILILKHGNSYVAFLSRHGTHHQIAPHEIPSRANIAALRNIGVRTIIAFSAVGSLQEEVRPRDFVIPDQIIDRTKGIRPFTFFEQGVVGHVSFAEPFDEKIAKIISSCAHILDGENIRMHNKGTVICMEGPQFSTRAESNLYRAWGGTVINMSALPEAKLAREAEMSYQMICMATDYDCWHSSDSVDVAMVMGHMNANSTNARKLVAAVLDELNKESNLSLCQGIHWKGSSTKMLQFMTKADGRGEEGRLNGKHLVNLFKDAKAAYHDRKNELKEHKFRTVQQNQARLEVRTITSEHTQRSRRSNRSNRSQRQRQRERNDCSRPPLTAQNLSYITESYTSGRSSYNPDQRSNRSASPTQNYSQPSDSITQRNYPPMHRRHTTVVSTVPPPYTSRITRSRSNPDLSKDSKIDMNLAYGNLPFDCMSESARDLSSEFELQKMVGKLDNLLLEARCLQHSATAIIAHLQEDPEAMAAVGLTLAELSTIVSKMGPSVLRTLQTASPAIFALLASPQFLIASGVAMGVTVIMFGGFHIIKSIQSNVEYKRGTRKLESAMTYSDVDIESIKSWRRGVAESEAFSLYSSADEEYITPEAARHYRGRIKNLSLADYVKDGSECSEKSCRTAKKKGSRAHSSSRKAPSEITSISRRGSLRASSIKAPSKAPSEITSISRRADLKASSTKAPSEITSISRRASLIAGSTTSSQGSDKMKKKKNKGKKPSILSTLFEIKRS